MLIQRPLTPSEAVVLHEELKTTPNIIGYLPQELTRFKEVFVAEVDGSFAGACLSKDLLFGWTDIAVLYVLPAFRGQGVGAELYTAGWEQARRRGRHIVTLSRSPEVIHLMKRFGMEVSTSMWSAPLALHLHMNRHMMSLYRMREAARKSNRMQTQSPLFSGVKRRTA